MAKAKSYWQDMAVEGERAQTAVHSWFQGLSNGMSCKKAEVQCDLETDREKKIRAFMRDRDGKEFQFERTRSRGGNFSISIKALP